MSWFDTLTMRKKKGLALSLSTGELWTQGDVPVHELETKQLLHLVFGGEVIDPEGIVFKEVSKLHMVGIYPNYKEALAAWRGAAQATVDNAQMRYFVVHIHRLFEPDLAPKP